MPTPRIFSQNPLHPNSTLTLDEAARRHCVQVLRLKRGAPIVLFDGEGAEFPATIEQIERRAVTVSLQQPRQRNSESPLKIHLYQGISKGERMDYAIQKATELGVTEITPLFCERSVVKLDPKRLQKKIDHWRGVTLSACEQCGRNHIPTLHPAQPLQQLESPDNSTGFLLNPLATETLHTQAPATESLSILIGPEGGLSEAEILRATESGWRGVQLGPRTLRTETATVVALTALQLLWGDL